MHSWQDAIALLLVTIAAASLLRRGWRLFFKRVSGCQSCAGCSRNASPSSPMVQTLVLLDSHSRPLD
jgi:hypothetical protein